MISLEAQIITVIIWLLVIKFCQIAIYPYLRPVFGNLSYGLAYPSGMLLLTLISWYLGFAKLPVYLVLIPFALAGLFAVWKKFYSINEIKGFVKWDIIFFGVFLITLAFRIKFDNLAITQIPEQYMNAAFIGSIMNQPVVTPFDPWFAGEDLTVYYYLGHWMMGILGILSGGIHTVAFNLALPTVFGLFAISAYAIGNLVLKRHQWLPLLVMIIPNAVMLWYIFQLGDLGVAGVASNIINTANGVNPIPLLKILVGAPHGMVFSWFNQMFFLCMLTVMIVNWKNLEKEGRYLLVFLMSLSLGTMPCMHTWDVIIYAPVYLCIGFAVWYKYENHDLKKIIPFAIVPVLSVLVYLPFLLSMISVNSAVSGVEISNPTGLIEFLGLYLFIIAVIIIHGMDVLKKYPWLILIPVLFCLFGYPVAGILLFCILLLVGKRNILPETVFGVAGLGILFITEFLYINDGIQGAIATQYNTSVKFGVVACIMLLLSVSIIIGKWVENYWTFLEEKHVLAIVSALFIIFILFPVNISVGDTFGYPNGGSLDGKNWMEEYNPSDYDGISYLLENAEPSDVVVEAAGGGDLYLGRVSVMTGLSTILGQINNEEHWRNGDVRIEEREDDIQSIYEDPSMTVDLMQKYNAVYLFVGQSELNKYNVSLPSSGLKEVFSEEGVSIYKIAS
ncbi:DUF2298 domain-containing protein [Methanolacinia paynteri]|uniref:DUF2298 domain-containing protein n=1 Tax=Methanolacinia paynteri TaxID=230356 RepID=UPI00064FDE5A|nr:DUF2298 domain-containing protein [Methanolacinia paynteri]